MMQAIWMRLNVGALDKPIHIDTVPNIIGGNASNCNHTGQVSGLLTRLPQPHNDPSALRVRLDHADVWPQSEYATASAVIGP